MLTLALVVIFGGWFLYRVGKELERPVRQQLMRWVLLPVAVLLMLIVSLRLGEAWLPLVAGGAWALRRVLPLVFGAAPRGAHHSDAGSSEPGARGRSGRQPMTHGEALDVLGLSEGATQAEVLAAYRQLIKKVHPDKPGGSHYLAMKLNQAKSTLLG